MMRADSRRNEQRETGRDDAMFDDEPMAEDWNVQLLGGLPREDGEETAVTWLPSRANVAPPSPVEG